MYYIYNLTHINTTCLIKNNEKQRLNQVFELCSFGRMPNNARWILYQHYKFIPNLLIQYNTFTVIGKKTGVRAISVGDSILLFRREILQWNQRALDCSIRWCGDSSPPMATIKDLFNEFQRDCTSVCEEPRLGAPKTDTRDEVVDNTLNRVSEFRWPIYKAGVN